jgi:FixJ family two-component response regulator
MNRLDPREQTVLEMLLQGHQSKDIAAHLEIDERTVRRVREKIREEAEREGLSPDGGMSA